MPEAIIMKLGMKILPYEAVSAAYLTIPRFSNTKITAIQILDTVAISLIDLNTHFMDIITINVL
jgi:hypothetical protein